MPTNPYVVVSGMGPGGLACAWEAAKQGKEVVVISDRTADFLRVQRVFLNPESREYLLSMLFGNGTPEIHQLSSLDKKFFDELITSTTLCIKDLERFIKRRLDALTAGLISYQYETQLSELNLEKGTCSLESLKPGTPKPAEPTLLSFNYIIGADGVNHHAVDLLNQVYKDPLVTYHSVESPKQDNHGSFYLSVEREDGEKLVLPKKQLIGMLFEQEEEDERICTFSFDFFSYAKYAGKKVKCSFVGELPEEIFELLQHSEDEKNRREVVTTYLTYLLNRYFLTNKINNGKLKVSIVSESKKHGLPKDKLKFTTFQTQLMEANTAAVEAGGHCFALVGDAYRRPNYQFGYGINDALQHAKLIGSLISGKLSLAEYTENCKSLAEETTTKTRFFNALPVMKREQVLKELEDQAEKSRQETWDKYKLRL